MLLCNAYVVDRLGIAIKNAQIAKMGLGDARSIVVNESLQGVRTIKLYAWEEVVARRVAAKRDLEMAKLQRMAALRAGQQFLSVGMPVVATVPVFVACTLPRLEPRLSGSNPVESNDPGALRILPVRVRQARARRAACRGHLHGDGAL
eukprot:5216730-Prymnesium_polylepis.1